MDISIIDSNWHNVFENCKEEARKQSLIVSPFLSKSVLESLLGRESSNVRVITRFNLDEMLRGVNDIAALEYLIDIGAKIKGIKNLHSKVYIFDSSFSIVTSANLTHAGLNRNSEFGILSGDDDFLTVTKAYFESLWSKAGKDLTKRRLNKWKQKIQFALNEKDNGVKSSLGDQGSDLGYDIPDDHFEFTSTIGLLPNQYFIKFFGTSGDRASRDKKVIDEIFRSYCHKVLSYPKGKRPRQVQDGDLIFIGRLVENPNDIIIFGRTIGSKYNQNKDNASKKDINKRSWRADWPHYIRVQDPEFISGKLGDGISLNSLMEEHQADIFASTWAHQISGKGNVNPRKAYLRQASVKLSFKGAKSINCLLEDKFNIIGKISDKQLNTIQ